MVIKSFVAPALLWSEVPSAINEMAFIGEISRALADHAIQRFLAGKLHVSERRHPELTITAVGIARELGWAKTYDAEYLALARLLDTRVVTLDLRLPGRCRSRSAGPRSGSCQAQAYNPAR